MCVTKQTNKQKIGGKLKKKKKTAVQIKMIGACVIPYRLLLIFK
jgi:hypothetical protein